MTDSDSDVRNAPERGWHRPVCDGLLFSGYFRREGALIIALTFPGSPVTTGASRFLTLMQQQHCPGASAAGARMRLGAGG
jgi:hypothetical protein